MLYRVKLNKNNLAKPDQQKDGFLAFSGQIIAYRQWEAKKKAREFLGIEVPLKEPSGNCTHKCDLDTILFQSRKEDHGNTVIHRGQCSVCGCKIAKVWKMTGIFNDTLGEEIREEVKA